MKRYFIMLDVHIIAGELWWRCRESWTCEL